MIGTHGDEERRPCPGSVEELEKDRDAVAQSRVGIDVDAERDPAPGG
jgi:hypothetical protein